MFRLWFCDWRADAHPITSRRDFSEWNPDLRHAERPWIHPKKDDTFLSIAETSKIFFVRRPCVRQRIIDMCDWRLELETVNLI